jgi:hypothetical protein
MGRGRAKAKQQKVARELKYNSHATDFVALQRELSSGAASSNAHKDAYADDDTDDDGDEYDGWSEAN